MDGEGNGNGDGITEINGDNDGVRWPDRAEECGNGAPGREGSTAAGERATDKAMTGSETEAMLWEDAEPVGQRKIGWPRDGGHRK